jgi:hypothetical protein
MATAIANILSGNALTGLSKVIDSIKGHSPEDAAALAQANLTMQQLREKYAADFAMAQIDENEKLNDTAGQNIRAEATSGDKYTQRARPSIIYVGLAIFVFNFCVLAFMSKWGWHVTDLPAAFWEAWTIVSTGYVFARTGDKTLGGQGGSIQLPFGIKFDSKGD